MTIGEPVFQFFAVGELRKFLLSVYYELVVLQHVLGLILSIKSVGMSRQISQITLTLQSKNETFKNYIYK
jgi:hypothetical protein